MRTSAPACSTNSQQISLHTIDSHKTSMRVVSTSKPAQAVGRVGLLIYFFYFFFLFFFISSCTQFLFQERKYDPIECFNLIKVSKRESKKADFLNKS